MNELTIPLDVHRKMPLYEQIYRYICREIKDGRMRAGEKLPSSRALALYLQVSRSTVDLAYSQVLSEGYIHSVPCKGYYICEIEALYDLPMEKARSRIRRPEKETYRYDFALSGIEEDGFPFSTWNRLMKEALLDTERRMFRQGEPAGEWGLREALADYLRHARGVDCTPEQIVVGAGNDYLLMLLSVILGRRDRAVAMENPTYPSAWRCFKSLGYDVRTVGMDRSGMSVEELENTGANVAYVMPSHQFPTGMIMPVSRRMQLLGWAARGKDRYIIEDDYDSEFRYKGKPIPALQGSDGGGRVIYLGTFSKSIAPSIRISYMALPDRLLDAYAGRGACFATTVSRVDQRVMERFLREGYFERHLNRMRGIYKSKHDALVNSLRQNRIPCRIFGEHAGVHLMLRLENGMGEEEARRRAAGSGIRVYGLSEYLRPDSRGACEPALLLGYAGMNCGEIERALELLARAWVRT